MSREGWQKVFETSLLHQAEIVRDFLENHNIGAILLDKRDSMYHFGLYEIMVHRDNVLRATTLVKNNIEF